ncbi:MAG: hypothetical protein ACRD51_12165 [Candidatus Acidiferrum sp.]
MTNMDHAEAVRLHAAEKYLLGELLKEQHAAYEEHYFDCPACAEDLKATAVFMESGRQVVRERDHETADNKTLSHGSWFGWLRPAFAIPVFAALLLFIGYQNSVTIPKLEQASSHAEVAEIVRSFSLMSLGSRGEGSASLPVLVGRHEDFILDVDMPGNSPAGYSCQIQDESGKVRGGFQISAVEAKNTVPIKIRGGSLQPGKYSLVIFMGKAPAAQAGHASVAAQKSFIVEFVP